MKYNFDQIIDRRHDKASYSVKWTDNPFLGALLNAEVNDDTIAVFTADMDFRCSDAIVDALHAVAEHGIYGYSGPFKSDYFDAIIQWCDKHYGWKVEQEEIIYSHGTVTALENVIRAFSQKGDGILIQRPVYGPFTGAIESTERTVVNNPLKVDENGHYSIDFVDFEEKAKDPRTKVFLLCNPHNPIGQIWPEEDVKKMAQICLDNDVIIAADEIHGDLTRVGVSFRPCATYIDSKNLIACTAANKTFNLAGLHASNVVIKNPELRATFMQSTGMTLPNPFTMAAVIAAYTQPESEVWLQEVREYIDGNVDFVLNFLQEKMPKVKCRRPEATYILWMDFSAYGISADEIHDRIYRKANVLFEGGPLFDPEKGAGFERICLPSPRPMLEEAFNRIAAAFEDLA